MERRTWANYLVVMETIVFGIGALVLAGAALIGAADSRRGVGDSRTDRREPWFPH